MGRNRVDILCCVFVPLVNLFFRILGVDFPDDCDSHAPGFSMIKPQLHNQ